jgi:hypothetical protein
MSKKLEVTVTAANFKRMDTKAYGVTSRDAWVKLKLGDQEKTTQRVNAPTLDPTWDETFVFDVNDPEKDKLIVTFHLGDLLIGQPGEYNLNGLFHNKSTYKGLAVVGGKLDMLFRAVDFGKEEEAKAEEEDDFTSFLG